MIFSVSSDKIKYDHIVNYDRDEKFFNFNETIYFSLEDLEPLPSIEEIKQVTKAIAEATKELIFYNFPYDISKYLLSDTKHKPNISITYSADHCSATITYTCKNSNYIPPKPRNPWF